MDQAIEKALRRATWQDSAKVVQYDVGSFDIILPIYLREVMWIGYQQREIKALKDQIRKEFMTESTEVDATTQQTSGSVSGCA